MHLHIIEVHKTEVLDWHFQIFLMRQKVLEFSFQKNVCLSL